MKITRAILCGILLWVLIFFEVSILMFGLKMQAGTFYYIIHYILSFLLIAISALVYFKGKVKKGAVQGVLLGIIFVVVGAILDAIITVPLFIKSYSFFNDFYLWLGYLETVVVSVIAGALKK